MPASKTLQLRIPDDLAKALQKYAEQHKIPLASEAARSAIAKTLIREKFLAENADCVKMKRGVEGALKTLSPAERKKYEKRLREIAKYARMFREKYLIERKLAKDDEQKKSNAKASKSR